MIQLKFFLIGHPVFLSTKTVRFSKPTTQCLNRSAYPSFRFGVSVTCHEELKHLLPESNEICHSGPLQILRELLNQLFDSRVTLTAGLRDKLGSARNAVRVVSIWMA